MSPSGICATLLTLLCVSHGRRVTTQWQAPLGTSEVIDSASSRRAKHSTSPARHGTKTTLALQRPFRGPRLSRRSVFFSLPALGALSSKALAASVGGALPDAGMASIGGGLPKELRVKGPASQKTCSKCVPAQEELDRLGLGYRRIKYLLDNWEKETTVCIKGCTGKPESCGCTKDPLIVQSYLGFKSMNDPLFRADEVMRRAEPLIADEDFEKYAVLTDKWSEKVENGNVMAYVSSWGEANPGGGQDNIARYLEKSRKEVVETAGILKDVCDLLKVNTV